MSALCESLRMMNNFSDENDFLKRKKFFCPMNRTKCFFRSERVLLIACRWDCRKAWDGIRQRRSPIPQPQLMSSKEAVTILQFIRRLVAFPDIDVRWDHQIKRGCLYFSFFSLTILENFRNPFAAETWLPVFRFVCSLQLWSFAIRCKLRHPVRAQAVHQWCER